MEVKGMEAAADAVQAVGSAKSLSVLERQLQTEREACAELKVYLKDGEEFHKRVEGERDREKSLRQAAETQAALWQKAEQKVRKELERQLEVSEERRREMERERNQALAQRRTAEVDLALVQQQLLEEVELRRTLEHSLEKEREQHKSDNLSKEASQRIQFLEEALKHQKADAQDVEQTMKAEMEQMESQLLSEQDKLRKKEAAYERLVADQKEKERVLGEERQKAEEMKAAAENLQKEAEDMLRGAKEEVAKLEPVRQELKEMLNEKEDIEKRKQEVYESEKTAKIKQAAAQEDIQKVEVEKEELERLKRITDAQQRETALAEQRLEEERTKLAEDRALDVAAREEWERAALQSKKEIEEFSAVRIEGQKLWMKYMAAQVKANKEETPESLYDVEVARDNYEAAEEKAEAMEKALLLAHNIEQAEWAELLEARNEIEQEILDFAASVGDRAEALANAAKATEDCTRLQAELQELQKEHTETQGRERESREALDFQKQENEELKAKLEAEVQALEKEREQLEQEQRAWQETKERLEATAAELDNTRQTSLHGLEQEKARMVDQLAAAQEDLGVTAENQLHLQRLQDALQEEKEHVEMTKAKLDMLQNSLEESGVELERKEEELEHKRRELEERERELEARERELGASSSVPLKAARALPSSRSNSTTGQEKTVVAAAARTAGIAELQEEFDKFRKERREVWNQSRLKQQATERQWLNDYLHQPQVQGGGYGDWNHFRGQVVSLGMVVHCKLLFGRVQDPNTKTVDLIKLGQMGLSNGSGLPAEHWKHLRGMMQQVDINHDGNMTFWEFLAIQLYGSLRMADRHWDLAGWVTFCSKAWHPNHLPSKDPRGAPQVLPHHHHHHHQQHNRTMPIHQHTYHMQHQRHHPHHHHPHPNPNVNDGTMVRSMTSMDTYPGNLSTQSPLQR